MEPNSLALKLRRNSCSRKSLYALKLVSFSVPGLAVLPTNSQKQFELHTPLFLISRALPPPVTPDRWSSVTSTKFRLLRCKVGCIFTKGTPHSKSHFRCASSSAWEFEG